MWTRSLLFVTALFLVRCSATQGKNSTPQGSLSADQLLPIGRTALTGGRLELISSAVHFSVSFEGSQCLLYAGLRAGQDHNYLQYEIDGVYQMRLRVSQTDTVFILAAAGSGRHQLNVYKATEAQSGPIFIEKLVGRNLQPIASPA